MTKYRLNTIAVDLTPVLGGGENGGAKIFALELLRHLANISPHTKFILLTHAISHDELAYLDGHNIRRIMVVGQHTVTSIRPHLQRVASLILSHCPARLLAAATRFGYRLNRVIQRVGVSGRLRNLDVDLLFCPFTAPTYFEFGIPTVCVIYDLQYKTYPEFFTAEDVAHRHQTFLAACRNATVLVAISEYSRICAINHGNVEPSSIKTVHLRLAKRFLFDIEHHSGILVRLGLVAKRYLLYPANFWRHKNHEMLLTAFGIACSSHMPADIMLVCTGAPGERQQWIGKAANAMKLGKRVFLPGFLSSDDLATLMANCSGVIFPSLYEGFGLPVIEAMAAGVPVACSSTTSMPEVAAGAAILFDPKVPTQIASAMLTLVSDSEQRAKLVEDGLIRAQEFADTNRMAREYWNIFKDIERYPHPRNFINGVHADGWVGPSLNIQTYSNSEKHSLEIKFAAPHWLPHQKVIITSYTEDGEHGQSIILTRGMAATYSLPLRNGRNFWEIRLNPVFVPAQTGYGDDHRYLSAMLDSCAIHHNNGESSVLYPLSGES
jgi:glycosyltransferase involved in cell wall biosynthesis